MKAKKQVKIIVNSLNENHATHRAAFKLAYLVLVSAFLQVSIYQPVYAGDCQSTCAVDADQELPYDPFKNPTQGLGDTKISTVEIQNRGLATVFTDLFKDLIDDGVLASGRSSQIIVTSNKLNQAFDAQYQRVYKPKPQKVADNITAVHDSLDRMGHTMFKSLFPEGAFDGIDIQQYVSVDSIAFSRKPATPSSNPALGWHTDDFSNLYVLHTVNDILPENIGTEYPADLAEVEYLSPRYAGIQSTRFSTVENGFSAHSGRSHRNPVPELGISPTVHRSPQSLPSGAIAQERFVSLTGYKIASHNHPDYPRLVAARQARFILNPTEAKKMAQRLLNPKNPGYEADVRSAITKELPVMIENFEDLDYDTKSKLHDRFNPARQNEMIFGDLLKLARDAC